MIESTILLTKRLSLRPWRLSDAKDLYRYASDERIGPRAGWPVHTSIEMSQEVILNVLQVKESYAICLIDEPNHIIGSIGLKSREGAVNEAEIGYWLAVPFWGKGYMPEAVDALIDHSFSNLQLETLWCGSYEGNQQSSHVQKKCGFQYAYTLNKSDVPFLGVTRKEHFTKLTRQEWHERRSR